MKCISKKLDSNKNKLKFEEQFRKREELLSKCPMMNAKSFCKKKKMTVTKDINVLHQF